MEKEENENVYNKIAGWFAENRYAGLMEKKYLDKLIRQMPIYASVLDLGCGTGKPILEYFIDQKLNIIGVDASDEMLKRARLNFPEITFVLQDMRQIKLNQKFDAIVAWHSFFHLPSKDQPAMFGIFAQHLKPKGILLFTSGTENGATWGESGGENLFHSSLDTEMYKDILSKHNFEVLEHTENDPECGFATVWMALYNPK